MKSQQQNNNPFERSQREYHAIKASDQLKMRVANHFSEDTHGDLSDDTTNLQSAHHYTSQHQLNQLPQRRRWSTWKRATISAATVVLCLGITFGFAVNLSPTFADAVSNVPGLAGIVKVFTFGRYQVDDGGFQVTIETPQIQGLLDAALEDKLNEEFKEYANALIVGVENDIDELKAEFGSEEVHFGIDSGYEVLTNDNQYLAIDLYLVNTVGSSTTLYQFYTIDKATQKVLTLEEAIIKMGAQGSLENALGKIEAYILEQMRLQMDRGEAVYWLDDAGMMPEDLVNLDSLFYINSDHQLVIAFEEYSVAPGSEGTPKFVIPQEVVK